MKSTTRRSVIAGTVIAFLAAPATFAQGRETAPGQLKKTVFPTATGPGSFFRTSTPTPTPLVDPTFTASPFPSATHTRTLVDTSPTPSRTAAPTKTPTPRATSTSGAQPSPTTPYSQPNPDAASRFDYTQERYETIDRINEERAKIGSPPLRPDVLVMDVAQLKANDHRDRGYTGHEAPGGACFYGTCFESPFYVWNILDAAGYRWSSVAECVWLGGAYTTEMDTVNVAVFMGSASHRAALLDPVFTHVGIGMTFDSRWNGVHVIHVYTHPSADVSSAQAFTIETTRSADGRLSQARAKRR